MATQTATLLASVDSATFAAVVEDETFVEAEPAHSAGRRWRPRHDSNVRPSD